MIKQKALVLAVVAALAMPLAACGNSGSSTGTDTKSETTTTQSSSSSSDSKTKDASYYAGQWRGSVETTGQTVYGTAGGTEPMLDVFLNEDGTAETKPCKNHEDLLTATVEQVPYYGSYGFLFQRLCHASAVKGDWTPAISWG